MQLRTQVSELAGWTVVTVYGEVDVATSPQLREQLIRLVSDGRVRLVLDLEGVDFLDSTGLTVLLHANQDRARGPLILRSPTRAVSRVLGLARVAELFRIEPQQPPNSDPGGA